MDPGRFPDLPQAFRPHIKMANLIVLWEGVPTLIIDQPWRSCSDTRGQV